MIRSLGIVFVVVFTAGCLSGDDSSTGDGDGDHVDPGPDDLAGTGGTGGTGGHGGDGDGDGGDGDGAAGDGDGSGGDSGGGDGDGVAGDGDGGRGSVPEGGGCTIDSDCKSGICEGPGCGTDDRICAPLDRLCTLDIAYYCGCDGSTFTGSGSCPGGRYRSAGPCASGDGDGDGDGNGGVVDGGGCTTDADCQSNVCEGPGCGTADGTCAPLDRLCTLDIAYYCGCDGATFTGSSGCPGDRYQSTGPCN